MGESVGGGVKKCVGVWGRCGEVLEEMWESVLGCGGDVVKCWKRCKKCVGVRREVWGGVRKC